MRTLSYSEFFLTIGANHFSGMPSISFVSRYNNHKVLYPIILFIFNRAKQIFNAFVMHQFPFMKATTKMLSHYKTVFKHITTPICHRIKEVIRGNLDADISFCSNAPTTFPGCVTRAIMLIASASTFLTMQTRRLSSLYCYPSFFTAIYTSCPYKFIKACSITIVPIRESIFGSSYFTYLWHIYIIPNARILCKGVLLFES